LIEVVTQEAEERAKSIDIRELTDERLVWKAAGILALVALFAGSAWFFAPKTVSVLLARQMLGEEEIPRAVALTDVTPTVWPAGEPARVLLTVNSVYGRDISGKLFVYSREEPTQQLTIPIAFFGDGAIPYPTDDGLVMATGAEVPSHFGEFLFEAWAGDGRLKSPGRVRRVPRPAVIKQDAAVILPAHCGTKPDGRRYQAAQPRGEIIGIPGSGALVSCKSQKTITKARVELLGLGPPDELTIAGREWRQVWKENEKIDINAPIISVKRAINMPVQHDQATCQFDLRPDESAYRIVVVDEYGFENADPPRRGIKIVPEEPPTVALLPEQFLPEQFPGAGIAEDFEVEGVPIPLGGAIRIAYSATHPYGLGRATLQYRVNEGPWQPFPLAEAPETEQTGPFDPRRGAFVNSKASDQVQFHAAPSRDPERLLPRTDGGGRFDFQTRGLPDLKIGDRVEFFVEVANRDPNSPQVGRSETRLKTVVTVPQLVQWIDATLRQEDRIRQLEQKQKAVFKKD
jgi:hypothetical protein